MQKESSFLFSSPSPALGRLSAEGFPNNGGVVDEREGNDLQVMPFPEDKIISDPVGSGGGSMTTASTNNNGSSDSGSASGNSGSESRMNFDINNFDFTLLNPLVLYDRYPTATLIGGGIVTLLIVRKLFRS